MSTPEPNTSPVARPIDAVAAISKHPEWYFRSGTFDAREALALLTDEAVAHGSIKLTVQQLDDWWVLASSHDWLESDQDTFFALTPDPARGPNTARVEVLLTAFCQSFGLQQPVGRSKWRATRCRRNGRDQFSRSQGGDASWRFCRPAIRRRS